MIMIIYNYVIIDLRTCPTCVRLAHRICLECCHLFHHVLKGQQRWEAWVYLWWSPPPETVMVPKCIWIYTRWYKYVCICV